MFVGVAGSGNPQDSYAFALLAPVSAGTTIFITDRGWDQTLNDGAGGFYNGEGLYCWTTITDLPAFTVVKIGTGGDGVTPSVGIYVASASSGIPTGLSSDGDQLIAFEGSVDYPYFVGAMNIMNAWQTSGSVDKSNSYLPPGLTNGSTALAWSLSYEGYYDCTKGYSGTAAQLRALILDPNNWIPMANGNFPSGALCDFNATPTFTSTTTATGTATNIATPTDTVGGATDTPTPSPSPTSTTTDTMTPAPTPTIPGTVLSPGDVVFTAYATSGSTKDNYAFAILSPVSAGTTIFITDRGWDPALNGGVGALRSGGGESVYCWTTNIDLPRGTVVEIGTNGDGTTPSVGIFVESASSTPPLSLGAQDQLIAFEGSTTYPYFVGAMNMGGSWLTSGTLGSGTSYLPPGLTDGSTAVAITTVTGNPIGYYDCTKGSVGTVSVLRALILSPANWILSTSTGNVPSGTACSFSLSTP